MAYCMLMSDTLFIHVNCIGTGTVINIIDLGDNVDVCILIVLYSHLSISNCAYMTMYITKGRSVTIL